MKYIDRFLNLTSGYFYFESTNDKTTVDRTYSLENQLTEDGYIRGTEEEKNEFNKRWKAMYNEDVTVV